jgi:methionyl aminopeptidase
MNKDVYEKYKRAGRIAAEAREYGKGLIKRGADILEVVNLVEEKIKENGAGIAFPVNIAVNEVAAHYSPRDDDNLSFKRGDVVKLDVGAHIDGYIADTAVTIEVETNNYANLIKAAEDALESTIEKLKAGIDLSEIGEVIEERITSYGFKPIDNLSGHSLDLYDLHSGISIPNIGNVPRKGKPKSGDVLAVEPFATNGLGHVISGDGSNIYLCNKSFRLLRDNKSKILFQRIRKEFKTLPFAQRWCKKVLHGDTDQILSRLSRIGIVKHYPQLIEAKGGIVAQKEHTVIVREDGCEVIT